MQARELYTQQKVANNIRANQLSDPGNAGVIKLDDRSDVFVALKSTGAETRTLNDPRDPHDRITLFMDTDGGAITVTAVTAINEAGNNTITFDDPGETIVLQAITIAGTAVWRPTATDGAGLTTV